MRMKPANIFVVGSILLILYAFIGHAFVEFYFGGKTEILNAGVQFNNLCNANGACPLTLEGWKGENGRLNKGRMLYIVPRVQGSEDNEKNTKPQTFKLIYRMAFPPDTWFEVQGGVGKNVTSGWTGR